MAVRVCFPFVGDSIGGSHLSARYLLQGLPELGFSVVTVLHREGPLAGHLEALGIAIERAPIGAVQRESSPACYLAAALAAAPALAGWLRRHDIALVHTNDVRMHLMWGIAARLAGVPHVWHQRTVFSGGRAMRALLRLPARILAISRTVTDTLPARPWGYVHTILNPITRGAAVDRHAARRALLAELGLSPRVILAGFVGNYGRQKRPEVLLGAAAQLVADDPSWNFVLAGDSRGREAELRDRVEALGLVDRVHLLPPRHPVDWLLAGLDVVAAPAVGEGHGRVLVEALLAGTPVAAARSAGHIEVLEGGGGRLVEPDDPEALAAGLAALVQDVQAVHAARAAGERLAALHRPERHVAAVAAVYAELLGEVALRDSGSERQNERPFSGLDGQQDTTWTN